MTDRLVVLLLLLLVVMVQGQEEGEGFLETEEFKVMSAYLDFHILLGKGLFVSSIPSVLANPVPPVNHGGNSWILGRSVFYRGALSTGGQ